MHLYIFLLSSTNFISPSPIKLVIFHTISAAQAFSSFFNVDGDFFPRHLAIHHGQTRPVSQSCQSATSAATLRLWKRKAETKCVKAKCVRKMGESGSRGVEQRKRGAHWEQTDSSSSSSCSCPTIYPDASVRHAEQLLWFKDNLKFREIEDYHQLIMLEF